MRMFGTAEVRANTCARAHNREPQHRGSPTSCVNFSNIYIHDQNNTERTQGTLTGARGEVDARQDHHDRGHSPRADHVAPCLVESKMHEYTKRCVGCEVT